MTMGFYTHRHIFMCDHQCIKFNKNPIKNHDGISCIFFCELYCYSTHSVMSVLSVADRCCQPVNSTANKCIIVYRNGVELSVLININNRNLTICEFKRNKYNNIQILISICQYDIKNYLEYVCNLLNIDKLETCCQVN